MEATISKRNWHDGTAKKRLGRRWQGWRNIESAVAHAERERAAWRIARCAVELGGLDRLDRLGGRRIKMIEWC